MFVPTYVQFLLLVRGGAPKLYGTCRGFFLVYSWSRVFDIGIFSADFGIAPIMDVTRSDLRKFGHVLFDVFGERVELFALDERIHGSTEKCLGIVVAKGSTPLPSCDVGYRIVVYQLRRKVPLALAPVDVEIPSEGRGDEHANAIVHPMCGGELSHSRIDEGKPCAALFPCIEVSDGAVP